MVITWHGEGAVKITEKEVTVAVNPHNGANTKMSKFGANIVLIGGSFASLNNIKDNPFVIDASGEYEVGGIFVYGVDSNKDKTVLFVVDMDDVKLGFLSGLTQETLSIDQLEFLEGVDVLFVPIGGKDTLNPNQAIKIINQIDPRIVIPIDYKTIGSKTNRDGVENFLKAFGVEKKFEKIDKLKITKKDLPQDDTKIYVLDLS